MKAIVLDGYGLGALQLREVERPTPGEGELLVRVRASSLNPYDRYGLTGTPLFARPMTGFRRPKDTQLGSDFAGTVESVGSGVNGFAPGDEVFGAGAGAFAEFMCVRADKAVAAKPANLTFEQAAAVPLAALTALHGLQGVGQASAGQKVLVNGAAGGVGTFAIQIAKVLGAEVTAVCSSRNVEQARSLGADDVVDYTREDFSRRGLRYDLLLDVTGTRSWRAYRRALEPNGRMVLIGAPKGSRLLGPVAHMARIRLAAVGSSRNVAFCMAKLSPENMTWLREQLEAGTIAPVIERRYELAELAEAFRYLGEGHARGKLVVTI